MPWDLTGSTITRGRTERLIVGKGGPGQIVVPLSRHVPVALGVEEQAEGSQEMERFAWSGIVKSVQPRIRLTRSYDQRWHTYLGYVLRLEGRIGGEEREFSVAVGKSAHDRHRLRTGQQLEG